MEITLLSGGVPWTPPDGVEAAIAYMQPSGTKGLYNKLADGTPAISISGNVATVILAPQMLTASGTVQASLVFNDQQLNRLTTFPFSLSVVSNPAAWAQKTEDYIRLQWLEGKLDEYLKKFEGGVDKAAVQRIVIEYLTANPPKVTETDPTVPDWAKQPAKPTYTADEVHALPDTYTPPNQTAQQVGADPAGTAASAVAQHNTDSTAHNDLRLALQELANRINAALDSDDTTLDQMSEVVAYIKSNKSLIDAITTSKVSVADIVNDLVTNVADKPLSAAQGVVIKGLIDELQSMIPEAYTLPMATETVLGGLKPVTATDAMTQPVGVTAEGRLVTKPGEGGSGISVTGATVGQTVKIAAVDENGVPTAWEPVDFPSGSGGNTEHTIGNKIIDLTIDEDVQVFLIDSDINGNELSIKKSLWVMFYSVGASTNTSEGYLKIDFITTKNKTFRILDNKYGIRINGSKTTLINHIIQSDSILYNEVASKWDNLGSEFPIGSAQLVSAYTTNMYMNIGFDIGSIKQIKIWSDDSSKLIGAGSKIIVYEG